MDEVDWPHTMTEKTEFDNTNLSTQITPPRSIVDKIFGGTKKAWILIMTLGLLGLYYINGDVPDEFILIYITIVSAYFGAGSVKLGMSLK